MPLDFRIEHRGHPARAVKVYDTGRIAFCQGEEERLWEALQAKCNELEEARQRCEAMAERIAGQSEALGKRAEKVRR